jgi:hypothetical protein
MEQTMKRMFSRSLCVMALCLAAGPARAALFDFGFGSVQSTFTLDAGGTTGSFEVSKIDGLTTGSVTHQSPAPTGVAAFLWDLGFTGGDFSLSMQIKNISASLMTATGSGQFTITDTTGDTIAGSLQGDWTRTGQANTFRGTMSNVRFDNASGDDQFNGHMGSASMIFPAPQPWIGVIQELSTTANWFSEGSYTTNSGSVDPTAVPVPAAVLLGMVGLGAAGAGLRRLPRETSNA